MFLFRRPPGRPIILLLAAVALVVALVVALLGACSSEPRTPRPRLVLIGVDGGSWNLIDPLLLRGEMPHLAALAARGVTAELDTVEPLISPTVWTSIATGRSPDAHGISSFFAHRRAIRVPTLWERLAAGGLRVGLYDNLLTWPPRELPGGFMIPGWLRRDDRVAPADVFERAGLAGYAYEVVDVGTLDDMVAATERELEEKPRHWRRLAETFDLDVSMVTFYAVDVISHRFLHTAFPEAFEPPIDAPARFADVLPRTLAGVDRGIGEIVAALAPEDHVIVVSDHGFRPVQEVSRLWGFDAAWLLGRADVVPERDGVERVNSFISAIFALAPRPGESDAALARLTELFASIRTVDGTALFELHVVRDPGLVDGTADRDDIPEWMLDVIRHRPAAAFLFALPKVELLDELGALGSVLVDGEAMPLGAFATPHVYSGDHLPTGIFVAAGEGIARRDSRGRLSVLDIAPLVTYLLDRAIPDDLEGAVPGWLIAPETLEARSPRHVAAESLPRLAPEGSEDLERDPELERRLRALGYVR